MFQPATRAPMTAAIMALTIASASSAQVPLEPSEGPGIFKIGPLSVAPGIFLLSGYDSNIGSLSPEEAAGDYTFVAVPQAKLLLGQGPVRLQGILAAEFQQYVERSDESATNNYWETRLDVGRGANTLTGTYSHRDHYARPTGFEVGKKSRHLWDTARVSGDMALGGRGNLSGDFTYERVRYDADAIYEGIQLKGQLDQNATVATASVGYDLTPLTGMFGLAEFTVNQFLVEPRRNSSGNYLALGVGFQPSALISGQVNIGYRRLNFTDPTVKDFSGLGYVGGFTIPIPTGTLLAITLAREPQYSYDAASAYYVQTENRLSLSQPLGQRILALGWARWLTFSYPNAAPSNGAGTYFGYNASLGLRLPRSVMVGVGGGSESKGSEYQAFKVMVFFTYGPRGLAQLENPVPPVARP